MASTVQLYSHLLSSISCQNFLEKFYRSSPELQLDTASHKSSNGVFREQGNNQYGERRGLQGAIRIH